MYDVYYIFDGEIDPIADRCNTVDDVRTNLMTAFGDTDTDWMDPVLEWCENAQPGEEYNSDDDFQIVRVA